LGSATPSWPDTYSPRFDSEFRKAADHWLSSGPDWPWAKAQGLQESQRRIGRTAAGGWLIESDPDAVSSVGARGIMQVMPGTWAEIRKAMGWPDVSPRSAPHNIFGGVWYQARMARIWARNRSVAEAYDLGLASYNAGPGTILAAQRKCGDRRLWAEIAPCLAQVSGSANAKQTIDYVRNIGKWRGMMP
jgi:hypothetical protein